MNTTNNEQDKCVFNEKLGDYLIVAYHCHASSSGYEGLTYKAQEEITRMWINDEKHTDFGHKTREQILEWFRQIRLSEEGLLE